MQAIARVLSVAALVSLSFPARAAERPAIGILPFDVVGVEGATREASDGLARLLRVEMIRGKELTPKLIELPEGTKQPVPHDVAAKLGASAEVALVVVGTVLDVDTSRSSTGAHTGGLLSGTGLGGRVSKTKATVTLQVELVDPASGRLLHTFEVEGSETDVGVGADVWTVLGSVDLNDDSWAKTPMGKALREAAQKINREVLRQARRLKS